MTVSSDFQIDTLSLIEIYSNSINDRELTQDLKMNKPAVIALVITLLDAMGNWSDHAGITVTAAGISPGSGCGKPLRHSAGAVCGDAGLFCSAAGQMVR